jgi:predicted nuclease of restriction endonuclease-like RecB superfamily
MIRNQTSAEYRQFFRWLKFHRLLHRAEGTAAEGYRLEIDGPLSLFSSTTKYGLQFALFLPAILLCRRFRLEAELAWGQRREPRSFYLDSDAGLVSHYQPRGLYVPAEIEAFLERFKQIAPAWAVEPAADVVELGREGVWVPDYRFVHRATGLDVHVELHGFWKRSSLDRLLRLLPLHGPPRYLLAVSDRLKVDEGAAGELPASIVRFKEIPNAAEVLARLERLIAEAR